MWRKLGKLSSTLFAIDAGLVLAYVPSLGTTRRSRATEI